MIESTFEKNIYERHARKYDEIAKKRCWTCPDVIFDIHSKFIKPKQKLLDVGIGTGLSSRNYEESGLKIYGIDNSKEMLKICKNKGFTKLNYFDLNELPKQKFPFASRYFEHVISLGVLQSIENISPLFYEVWRVLKNDGIFAFTTRYSKNNKSEIKVISYEGENIDAYFHSEESLDKLISDVSFSSIIHPVKFLAYQSSAEKKDIYFLAHFLRKKSKKIKNNSLTILQQSLQV